MVKRREFIKLIGGALVSWPFAANAQKAPPLPTIGFLGPNTEAVDGPRVRALVERLRERGWIEGRTVAIEYRWAGDDDDRLPVLAAELVQRQVTVIVAGGSPSSVAAKAATAQITTAVTASITADNPSARRATPSGGAQPPSV